jgi:hypothetical protein
LIAGRVVNAIGGLTIVVSSVMGLFILLSAHACS